MTVKDYPRWVYHDSEPARIVKNERELASLEAKVPGWRFQPAKHVAQAPPLVTLRSDGPTLEEFVAAGHRPYAYPPEGYAPKASPGLDEWRRTGAFGAWALSVAPSDPPPQPPAAPPADEPPAAAVSYAEHAKGLAERMTADELMDVVKSVEVGEGEGATFLRFLRTAESEGKNRKTVIDAINKRLGE